MGEAGLKRRTALGMATLLIGANLPDIDAVMMLVGDPLPHRRGWTHGVLALVALPLLLTALILLYDRLVRRTRHGADRPPVLPRQILLLAGLSILSHPVLDWLNTYGVRLFMPFSGRWFYGDSLFIVDPWMWILLLAAVLLGRRWKEAPARWALGISTVYALAMVVSSAVGRGVVADEVRRMGGEPLRVLVSPRPVDPFRRLLVVEEPGGYRFGTLRWTPAPQVQMRPDLLAHNRDAPDALAAAQHPDARGFLVWSRFPIFIIDRRPEGTFVLLDDARYSDGTSPSWAAVRVFLPPHLAGVERQEPGGR